jgi:thiamine-monophosphate kinase
MAQLIGRRVLAESGLGRGAMDVSDGLYATVRTLCELNGLGATMETDVQLDSPLARVCEQSGLSQFDLAQIWGDWSLVTAPLSPAIARFVPGERPRIRPPGARHVSRLRPRRHRL